MALIAADLNAGHSGGDNVATGIYSPSSPTSIPPFSPSLISLVVSVDVKHHVYETGKGQPRLTSFFTRLPNSDVASSSLMVLYVHRNHDYDL